MKLSLTERLQLINQYRILAKLEPEEAEAYKEFIDILQNAYEPLYYRFTEWMAKDEDAITQEEAQYVYKVLAMFEALHLAIKDNGLALDDQQTHRATFSGFDGNNEGRLLGFANAFCGERRYEDLKRDGEIPNSHGPMRSIYERMLTLWDQMGGIKNHRLTPGQVTQLLEA
ncbi:YfbU family protein [Deinococcus rubellus]|uniref:YfbU family protein n=1 Tax=Deinococcus rubellus TaxID=1889240 RepID=UPI0031EC6A99